METRSVRFNVAKAKFELYDVLGNLFFLYFLVLSVILYKECTIQHDYAWELVQILNGDSLPVYFRWATLPWRLFAVIGPDLGMSLRVILILTSFWFVFLKYVVWILCQYLFKNRVAGLLVILSLLLSHSEGFYAQGVQVYNASLYFCLFYVILEDDRGVISNSLVKVLILLSLMIFIRYSYLSFLLLCPLMLIYSLYKKVTNEKVFIGFAMLVYMMVSLVLVYLPGEKYPYEAMNVDAVFIALRSKGVKEIGGILIYLVKDLLSLSYLFPLVLFLSSAIISYRRKQYLLLSLSTLYVSVFFILITYKLVITYNAAYPLTDTVNFYIQSAYYQFAVLLVSVFFIHSGGQLKDQLSLPWVKTLVVGVVLFYSSTITTVGVNHYEYNRYLDELFDTLEKDFNETFIVIDSRDVPYRFARWNINIDNESFLKSNLRLGKSKVLFVTPTTTAFTIEDTYPSYVHNFHHFHKRPGKFVLEENRVYFDYKILSTKTFENYNHRVFRFDNFHVRAVDNEYMKNFNHNYGFANAEYRLGK